MERPMARWCSFIVSRIVRHDARYPPRETGNIRKRLDRNECPGRCAEQAGLSRPAGP